jgi:hypothetical protein
VYSLFSAGWFGEVALFAAVAELAATAVRVIPRWAEGRSNPSPARVETGRGALSLTANLGIALLAQATVIALIRAFSGPISSDVWALFAAMSLCAVMEELRVRFRA